MHIFQRFYRRIRSPSHAHWEALKSWLMSNNPNGISNWKTLGFFGLLFLISHTQLIMSYSFQALLYAVSHNLPSPITCHPGSCSSFLTGLPPPCLQSALHTNAQVFSSPELITPLLLKNLQWHPSTYTRFLYLHPFHDLEPRTHVFTLILVPNTMIESLPSFPNSPPDNHGLISLFNLQAPKDIHH